MRVILIDDEGTTKSMDVELDTQVILSDLFIPCAYCGIALLPKARVKSGDHVCRACSKA